MRGLWLESAMTEDAFRRGRELWGQETELKFEFEGLGNKQTNSLNVRPRSQAHNIRSQSLKWS